MSLQFIMGPQSANKRSMYIQDINQVMSQDDLAKFFLIVPEHAKFEGEMKILEELWQTKDKPHPNFIGSINLQVFSFSRLAWFFLKDDPIFQDKQLSDVGISMLLRKILLDVKDDLIIFRREIDKKGFVQQLTDLFKELRSGRITVDDLTAAIDQENDSVRLLDQQAKLKELSLIYQHYCEKIDDGYLQYDMVLEALATKITQTDMTDVHLYIDGYYYFSAQELQIIYAFLHQSAKVIIVLDLDQPYIDAPPETHQLFYSAGMTYYNLYHYARSHQLPVLHDKRVIAQVNGYHENMIALDRYWVASTSGSRRQVVQTNLPESAKETIEIWSCDTKQAEITHIATSINQLIAEKDYRYKDFLILARRVEDYETILSPLFKKAKLNVFYDKAEEMKHHPFADFIDSLFRIRTNYWRYPDIMRLLRTELLVPGIGEAEDLEKKQQLTQKYRDTVDRTENILLGYGFEGHAWMQKDDWKVYGFNDEDEDAIVSDDAIALGIKEANTIKRYFQKTLVPFYEQLDQIKTGRDAAVALFQFLEKHHLDKQLLYWRDEAIEAGQLDRARQHEQVWKTFTSLLDEYVETMGDTVFDAKIFYDILMTGFENATYSLVPPTIDEVIFSSIEGARFSPAKVVYIIGATQDNLPKAHDNRSLLTEEEREVLQVQLDAEGKALRPSITQSTAAEPYIAYQAFLAGTDKLFLTYPLNSEDGKNILKISPYVGRIAKDLDIPIQHRSASILDAEDTAHFLGTKEQNIGQLVRLLRDQLVSEQKMPLLWRRILSYLYRDDEALPVMQRVFGSLKYKNVPAQLTPEITEKLYGKNLYLSVSQLESYYLDSYSHFLQYGLRLRERQKYELTAAGTGEFYHDALENIVSLIREKNTLTVEELEGITESVLELLFGSEKYAIFSSSNRMAFIKEQLKDTIQRMAWIIHGQRRLTTFENIQTEAIFGQTGEPGTLKGMSFPLQKERSLFIRGKIDRIDQVKHDDKTYLSILDYKSSKHTFKFDDAYYGLAMQMITYLDVALMNAEQLSNSQVIPAGAFYLHVKNPYMKILEKPTKEDWEETLLADNKIRGLIIADSNLTKAMEPQAQEGKPHLVLPVRYTKNGGFYKNINEMITPEELDLLIKNNRRRIEEAGRTILDGTLKMNPVKGRLFIPSVQGPYRAVSQFDSTLQENRYRRLEKMSKQDVLHTLQLELALLEDEEDEEGGEI